LVATFDNHPALSASDFILSWAVKTADRPWMASMMRCGDRTSQRTWAGVRSTHRAGRAGCFPAHLLSR